MNTHNLVLIRSDQGDGGWSLHPAGGDDPEGDFVLLLSGEAELVDGEWSHPNQHDYDTAEVARLQPAYKAFLATLPWDDEMKRSLGQLPQRESPEIEQQWFEAQARWLASMPKRAAA